MKEDRIIARLETNIEYMENRPKWEKLILVMESGEVYFPASIFSAESLVEAWMFDDGVLGFIHEGHLFAPSTWIADCFPVIGDTTRRIADLCRGVVLEAVMEYRDEFIDVSMN